MAALPLRNAKIGDLVVLKEDNIHPSHWRLGRIFETYLGKDGLVRSVKIKTAFGEYNRPITKIGVLIESTN